MATIKLSFSKNQNGELIIRTPPETLKKFLGSKKTLYLTDDMEGQLLLTTKQPNLNICQLPPVSLEISNFIPQD